MYQLSEKSFALPPHCKKNRGSREKISPVPPINGGDIRGVVPPNPPSCASPFTCRCGEEDGGTEKKIEPLLPIGKNGVVR